MIGLNGGEIDQRILRKGGIVGKEVTWRGKGKSPKGNLRDKNDVKPGKIGVWRKSRVEKGFDWFFVGHFGSGCCAKLYYDWFNMIS